MASEATVANTDKVQVMLNQYARNQEQLKRGTFDVTLDEGRLVILWNSEKRTEKFLVKEPVTPGEVQGTVTDVIFRLKRRLNAA